MTSDAFHWYDENVERVADAYEAVSSEVLHGWLAARLPAPGARALDVGAGTGRDAAWLASRGLSVVAAEPAHAMRALAERRHAGLGVTWVDDALPSLSRVRALGVAFDLVLMSAVWMHVDPEDRASAFAAIASLLAPGGLVAMTLRHGPPDLGRFMHPVSADEVEALAHAHGFVVEHLAHVPDGRRREGVSWTQVGVRRPGG